MKNLSLGITAAVFAVALTALLRAGRTSKPHIHFSAGVVFPPSPVRFLEADRRPLPPGLPRITHVQVIDLDADGTAEIVACDALRNRISRLERGPDGSWRETTLIAAVGVPAHATFTDIEPAIRALLCQRISQENWQTPSNLICGRVRMTPTTALTAKRLNPEVPPPGRGRVARRLWLARPHV